MFALFTRGPERIRTAVEAFAELCLATRPQDHFFWQPFRQLADTVPFFLTAYPPTGGHSAFFESQRK